MTRDGHTELRFFVKDDCEVCCGEGFGRSLHTHEHGDSPHMINSFCDCVVIEKVQEASHDHP